ncbi:MAG: T9SS type A sorting domain-containing protein [Ignavibacteriaceae bacterium]|nr:T9SS type A sorting domain-containing protein [Ignavibacteriaceae bacterium]
MKQIILLFMLFASVQLIYSQPRIDIRLQFADGSGETRVRYLGIDSLATTGVDANFGEEALPPMPPGFEVRFDLNPFGVANQVYKDYRNAPSFPFSDTLEHRLLWQYASGATSFTINYNLPAGVQMRLQDVFTPTGLLFNSGDLVDSGSYSIPNAVVSGFTSAKLFMMYSDVIPVELTSFNAIVYGNEVTLTWQTAAELNNLGFDVEQKIEDGNWEKIGFVLGHGTSTSVNLYTFSYKLNTFYSKYSFRLKQIDLNGSAKYFQEIYINIDVPITFDLKQNYPNPFNPSTYITFSLPVEGNVKLSIYNQIGQLVDIIVNSYLQAGTYSYSWNGENQASGIYFYEIMSNDFKSTKKMLLIK